MKWECALRVGIVTNKNVEKLYQYMWAEVEFMVLWYWENVYAILFWFLTLKIILRKICSGESYGHFDVFRTTKVKSWKWRSTETMGKRLGSCRGWVTMISGVNWSKRKRNSFAPSLRHNEPQMRAFALMTWIRRYYRALIRFLYFQDCLVWRVTVHMVLERVPSWGTYTYNYL